MRGLPEQLKRPEFRFVLLNWPGRGEDSKRAIEQAWQTTANYPHDHPRISAHLEAGGNIGVLCGPGGLRVLDLDILKDDRGPEFSVKNADKVFASMSSFAVRSAHGGLHLYFICRELRERMRGKSYIKLPHNAGELRLERCYVCCPPSRLDSEHIYSIINPMEIAVSEVSV